MDSDDLGLVCIDQSIVMFCICVLHLIFGWKNAQHTFVKLLHQRNLQPMMATCNNTKCLIQVTACMLHVRKRNFVSVKPIYNGAGYLIKT